MKQCFFHNFYVSLLLLYVMKKVLTILITIVFLASGLQVSIDRHYCSGNLASVKVSLTGEKATCGMEKDDSDCSNQLVFGSKCCDDQMSSVSGNNNYCPVYFQISKPLPQKQVIYFQNILISEIQSFDLNFHNNVFPPGGNFISRLTQPDICVFRI